MSHPLVGWRSSDQDGWGLRSNLIGRGIFEDFHAGSKGNLYSKIATHRFECLEQSAGFVLWFVRDVEFLGLFSTLPLEFAAMALDNYF